MKKLLMFATLSMATMFAITSGSSASAAQPTAPETGTCKYYCGATAYKTAAACAAACASFCEPIC